MDLGLERKSVLVTAASRGLGLATAKLFAAEGARVTIASRNESSLQAAAHEIHTETGHMVNVVRMDVNRSEDIARVVASAEEFGDGLDSLICNAGGPPSGAFSQIDDSTWYQAFEQNLLSVVRLSRAALPHLRRSSSGRIVNITSTSVKQTIPGLVLSNTMRAGVWGLTKTLSQELGPFGILVNTVGPGRISTDRIAELDGQAAARQGVDVADIETKMAAMIPLGRYGTPEEFARMVVFLASPLNTYVTGQALLVDGGMVTSL
ncbi:SDR family oxidoreductase [Alicyclobacillus fodiniaquatilis]|uniref:SDR family oxidoreductase n=1 Tax=Alicyclobacillus fodiniaquatilis TaxID=1661150 RepID=A0ABW4JKM2_9BACL